MSAGTGLTSQLMIAKEATPGTYDTPDHSLEFLSENLQYTRERVWSNGLRVGRRMRTAWMPGAYNVSGPTAVELTTDTQALLWEACIGGTVATTGSGPYTHVFTPGALATYTIQVGKSGSGGTTHPFNYLGCKAASWSLSCAAGEIPVLEIDWLGTGFETSSSLGTPSYAAFTRLVFTQGVLSVASSEVCVDSFTLSGNNGLNTQHKICATNPGGPTHREADFREVTGSFVADFADLTQFNRFRNSTENVAFSLVFTSGSESVTLAGNVEFDGTTPNIGGPGITKDNSDFTFYGSTDANALTVTVVNGDTAP